MTDREKIALTGARETTLATLYYRALESRSPNPILGDHEAEQAVQRIDYDFSKLTMTRSGARSVALRGKTLDRWVEEYLGAHPVCTVVHLGCGLDTRVYRIDPPSGIEWYDIDFPDVIDLRRRLFADRADYHTIGSSVTDPRLFDKIPGDRPVLVVAEGLTMYLSEGDGEALLRRISAHFPCGQIIFDALDHRGRWLAERIKVVRSAGARLGWAVDDPHELEKAVPGLVLDTAWSYADAPEVSRYPWFDRWLLWVSGHVSVLSRIGQLLRYRFGKETG